MKKYVTVLALLALPACFGVSDGVDLTPDGPEVSQEDLNTEFGATMNNVRVANNAAAMPLTYDARVGAAAQIHADDMLARDYLSIEILGSDDGMGNPMDIGDIVTAQGYTWSDIGQLVAQGEFTVEGILNEFADDDCLAVGAFVSGV